MEGFQGKHLKCLSADLIEKYSCFFFSSFQKVPKHLMYDGLSHFGHLLSLPSSTYQGGYLLRYYIHVFGKTCWYGKHVVTVVRTCIKSLVGATRTPTDTSFVIVREFKS